MSELEQLRADMRDAAEVINEFMSHGDIAWQGKSGAVHHETCNRIINKYFVYPNPTSKRPKP